MRDDINEPDRAEQTDSCENIERKRRPTAQCALAVEVSYLNGYCERRDDESYVAKVCAAVTVEQLSGVTEASKKRAPEQRKENQRRQP